MLIKSKLFRKINYLNFYSTHCYFYCLCVFNKHSTWLIFNTLLYFASDFLKFVRIILTSVSNIYNIKIFSKLFMIYPYPNTIFYDFNNFYKLVFSKFAQISVIFSVFSFNVSFIFLTFSFNFSYLSFSFKIVTNSLWLISMSISALDTRDF